MPKIVRNIASLFVVKLMVVTIGLTVLASIDDAEARRVRVRGYFRKDGTYVRPHIGLLQTGIRITTIPSQGIITLIRVSILRGIPQPT